MQEDAEMIETYISDNIRLVKVERILFEIERYFKLTYDESYISGLMIYAGFIIGFTVATGKAQHELNNMFTLCQRLN